MPFFICSRYILTDSSSSFVLLFFSNNFDTFFVFCIFLLYINRTTTCLYSSASNNTQFFPFHFFFSVHFEFRFSQMCVRFVIHTEHFIVTSYLATSQNCSLLCLIFSQFGYFSCSLFTVHCSVRIIILIFELHGIVLKGNRTHFVHIFLYSSLGWPNRNSVLN